MQRNLVQTHAFLPYRFLILNYNFRYQWEYFSFEFVKIMLVSEVFPRHRHSAENEDLRNPDAGKINTGPHKFSAEVGLRLWNLLLPRAAPLHPADLSWRKHRMSKSAGVCTRLTPTMAVCNPHDLRAIIPRMITILRPENKDSTCGCCRAAEIEQSFFHRFSYSHHVLFVSSGHVGPNLFPNLRTKPRRFQTLDSKKEARVHQSFCSMVALSFCDLSAALGTLPVRQETASQDVRL